MKGRGTQPWSRPRRSKGPSKSFRLAQSTGLRMKAARSWRRKGTSGRPDRLAPCCSKVRACLPPRNTHRVARLATTSSTTANKANSHLVAAKRCVSYDTHRGIRVSQIDRILLANLLQGSRSTVSCASCPKLFALKEGIWDTHISALLSSPTVSGQFLNLRCACLLPVNNAL